MEMRIGSRAAAIVVAIGVAYLGVLAVGFSSFGLDQPITDPVLLVMEILTLLSAPPIVIVIAAIHVSAPAERKIYSTGALAFVTVFAGLTSTVHFVELSAVRQLGQAGISWPSAAYAVELLAWDWFLGLGLICAGLALPGRGAERAVRLGLLTSGLLAVAGTVGPLVADMRFQRIGILGYAVAMPPAFLLLSRYFRQCR